MRNGSLLGSVKSDHLVDVERVDDVVVFELVLGRLEKNGTLVDGECQIVVNRVANVTLIDRYLTSAATTTALF